MSLHVGPLASRLQVMAKLESAIEGSECLAADSEDWRVRMKEFVTKQESEPAAKKRKRMYRTSSFDVLRAMDHSLKVATDKGFGDFELHPPMALGVPEGWIGTSPPPPPPVFTITLDQDSSNECANFWMKYQSSILGGVLGASST